MNDVVMYFALFVISGITLLIFWWFNQDQG
jgi:hypothetical protein